MKMNNNQKKKRSFRNSKKWKDFRKNKMLKQNNLDPITKSKLNGRWNLHHKNLKTEDYENLNDEELFIALNKTTHDVIHWCLTYIKKTRDMSVIDRLYEEVMNEGILNGFLVTNDEGDLI